MKRIFSIFVAALFVLSVMTTAVLSVGAEDPNPKTQILYEIPNELCSNQMDGQRDGWRNSKVDSGKPGLQYLDLDGQTGLGFTFSGTEPNYFNTIRFLYYTTTPLDLSDIKYVELDLYISDASKYSVSANSIMIELCSSGRQDAYEISTDVRPELENGWNHIKVDFSAFKPGSPGQVFDVTAWNFFRLCINGPYNTGDDELTVAIANLTFWNGLNEDGLTEEEAARQEMLEKIQPVLDKINELKDIKAPSDVNADNLESLKTIIAEAYELYNALDQEAKSVVSDENGVRILKTAERAVKEYEEEQAEKEECTAHIDENSDSKCDVCGADVLVAEPEEPEKPDDPEEPKDDPETPETPDTDEPTVEEGGCASSLTVGAAISMMLAGVWTVCAARKKNS